MLLEILLKLNYLFISINISIIITCSDQIVITTLGCFALMAKKRNGSVLFDGCISSAAQEYRTDSQRGCSEGYCTWLLQNNFFCWARRKCNKSAKERIKFQGPCYHFCRTFIHPWIEAKVVLLSSAKTILQEVRVWQQWPPSPIWMFLHVLLGFLSSVPKNHKIVNHTS